MDDELSFSLVDDPWLPAQFVDGSERELSLSQVFEQAGDIRRLTGDVPTQEFALMRLLLAILHDSLDGPEDIEAWQELWTDDAPFAPVPAYLKRHRDVFELLHPTHPFFQVADLRTAKDEVASLNRIVVDVPNGDPFFSMRQPGVGRLGFAEAARWLVHVQAYDTSGIKSGAVGDPRVKSGKGYPQGIGWTGNLGGVMAEGDSLRESLLLNLVAADSPSLTFGPKDRPAWRSALPCGPAESTDIEQRPYGIRDLYTWQSRRVRLHHDADGVHGVVLTYGDRLEPHNRHRVEPMTGWRRSEAQEKKRGEALVYLPREHDPSRAAWRGLSGLLANRARGAGQDREGGAAYLRPRVLDWVARLSTSRVLPKGHLIRARIFGACYGTQQSVVDEMVDDGVLMAVVLLHETDKRYGQAAVDALADAEDAVGVLGNFAADLAQAAGADPAPRKSAARDLAFGTLDTAFRRWLAGLGDDGVDPAGHRDLWKRTLNSIIRELGESLLSDAGLAAWEGRVIDGRWLNDAAADLRFRRGLSKLLGPSPRVGPGQPPADGVLSGVNA